MLVTEIKEISKTKYLIYIDYEEAFSLYKSECKKYNIILNEEIAESTYLELINNVLLKRAKIRIMNLLKNKDYTEQQLKDKLNQGYYPQSIIDKALEYIKIYRYIDDLKYAENFIKYANKSKSKRQIELLLIQKGVSSENVKRAFDNYNELYGEIKEEELIHKFISKKKFDFNTATVKEQQKIIAFLYRKGFSLDKIYKVLEKRD